MQTFFRTARPALRFMMCDKKPEMIDQPSFVKDLFLTIKEGTKENIVRRKQTLFTSCYQFKKEANGDLEQGVAKTCFNFAKLAWRKTFPSGEDDIRTRMNNIRAKVAEEKRQEELREYTEEELSNMQDQLPEWKRTALSVKDDGLKEKESLRKKVMEKVSRKLQEQEYIQQLKKSEQYEEYKEFKNVMTNFKQDIKERINENPNMVIQTSLFLMNKVTDESDSAKAIKQMKLFDPNFDIYEFEREAKVIFEETYKSFLLGELSVLEKICGETALAYFRVNLRRNKEMKVEPKYKNLWNIEEVRFTKGFVADTSKLPVFVFTIKTQEVHCLVSIADRLKIMDGDVDRIMSVDYQFALTPHQSPDLENCGHKWEMVEIQPQMVVKMLV